MNSFDRPLGFGAALLLATRTGFAATVTEAEALAPLGQADAVERLLAGVQSAPAEPPPAFVRERLLSNPQMKSLTVDARRAIRDQARQNVTLLRLWWLQEMYATVSPLTERLTLFWHNHFVSAHPKVQWPRLLYTQNLLLRRHAAGSFREMLHDVARDPAMLTYLDGSTSSRRQPNENFAREVMELFTLGQGHYSETDIKEAARAFTGWSVNPATDWSYLWRPSMHDEGEKTVFGRRGRFSGEQVLDLLLEQPAAAPFIIEKLWREFVSPQPDESRVAAVARQWRASGYQLKVALRGVLLQPELVKRDHANALIKSPVELVIGLARQTGTVPQEPAAAAVGAMGQALFKAPNVRGWPGGEAWINTQTLLARRQFIDAALRPRSAAKSQPAVLATPAVAGANGAPRALGVAQSAALPVDLDANAQRLTGGGPERPLDAAQSRALASTLLVLPPVNPLPERTLAADAVRTTALDAVYQLK